MGTSSTPDPLRGNAGDPGNLTDESFWDDFWQTIAIPARPDPALAFDRSFSRVLQRHLQPDPELSLVEIGCAPGRWLVHCHERFGYHVSGFEYSAAGLAKTQENLDATGVPATVYAGDFMAADLPLERFDVVLSLGFIEHFDDPLDVLRRHALILKKGGLLFLEVPNLRGLNLKLLQWTHSPLLAVHNLAIMDPAVIEAMTKNLGLETIEIKYAGGYEPSFIDPAESSLWVRAGFGLCARVRRSFPLDNVNARWISGYLYGVFRKR
ncbi:MAG TPA: class I SAM-dependent methyltransferase [Chloroflexota bacterium]